MPNWQPNPISRPIKFDLVTLLVATTLWAVLLSGMRLLGFPFRGYVIVSVVLIVVGLTLLLFRKLGHPVLISMGCGAVFTVIGGLLLSKSQGIPIQGMRFLEAVVSGAAFGLFAFGSSPKSVGKKEMALNFLNRSSGSTKGVRPFHRHHHIVLTGVKTNAMAKTEGAQGSL